jgi:hypothetical protein
LCCLCLNESISWDNFNDPTKISVLQVKYCCFKKLSKNHLFILQIHFHAFGISFPKNVVDCRREKYIFSEETLLRHKDIDKVFYDTKKNINKFLPLYKRASGGLKKWWRLFSGTMTVRKSLEKITIGSWQNFINLLTVTIWNTLRKLLKWRKQKTAQFTLSSWVPNLDNFFSPHSIIIPSICRISQESTWPFHHIFFISLLPIISILPSSARNEWFQFIFNVACVPFPMDTLRWQMETWTNIFSSYPSKFM